jgi:hypothetical protein
LLLTTVRAIDYVLDCGWTAAATDQVIHRAGSRTLRGREAMSRNYRSGVPVIKTPTVP